MVVVEEDEERQLQPSGTSAAAHAELRDWTELPSCFGLKSRHDMILSDASAGAILCLQLSLFWMTR